MQENVGDFGQIFPIYQACELHITGLQNSMVEQIELVHGHKLNG